jgi:hypothetical protein
MTTAADDPAGEEAFEAYLAGKSVPEQGASLAAFAGAVRATATQPGRPSAALAELLATGLLVDQPPLSARTAKRRRRRMWFFSAIFAKIASAGAIAQAATGAGIVLVGFTGVGAAGALPTPVQHGFTSVVAAISPVSGSDSPTNVTPAGESSDSTESTTPASSSAAEPTGAVSTETSTADSTDAPVSSTPKNHGQEVSSLIHERNAARKAAHKSGSDGSDDSDATSTETRSTEAEAPESESSDDAGEHSGSRESSHSGGEKSGRGGE